jgi:hypothetical protein
MALTYYPANNYVGSDSLAYSISDGRGGTASATMAVTVLGPPVANNDVVYTTTGTTTTFDPRTNDTDPNGFALTVSSAPATTYHGTASYTSTSVTYTSASTFVGNDNFSYTISDGHGQTATASVNVSVAAGTPVANADSLTAPIVTNFFGTKSHKGCLDPTTNDVANGPSLTVSSVTQGSHSPSNVTLTGNQVCYNSTQTSGGWTDSFTYTVSNGTNSATATVSVTATP